MEHLKGLFLVSYTCIVFAFILGLVAAASGWGPGAPGYLVFLFIGIIGLFAARAQRDFESRVSALEKKGQ